ncbi:hypothetical protein V6Z12_A02G094100 [Gossypium hirsutum]
MTIMSFLFGLLSKFEATKSHIPLAYGSTFRVLGSETINLTSSISLNFLLNLSDFFFYLLPVSKLTRALNCSVSFFLDHCLFQDITTKLIIGRGRESGGLYVLDTQVPRSVA